MDSRGRAIEELYRRRYPAFRNVVATIVRDPDAAQDVVQETFARAFTKRRQLRDPDALESWVWRIALRAARERGDVPPAIPLEDAFDPTLPQPQRDPDLDGALRALAPRRRLVVFLRYFAGLSYAEIAEALEIAEGTVAATLAQAREELAGALTPEEASR
jgi:RNA polymerase sigma-70 factor (ECF subfamily)